VPYDPVPGVTVRVHDVVGFPQVEGDIATVAEPLDVILTDGAVETLNAPVPPTVKGTTAGAPPPTMEVFCNPLNVGPGIAASAPSASTRPYPNVLLGENPPSGAAPVCMYLVT
jgi:hypothetical protein